MTIVHTIWLVFALSSIRQVGLYFLLPYLVKKHEDNEEFKRTLRDDNIEIYRKLESLKPPQ